MMHGVEVFVITFVLSSKKKVLSGIMWFLYGMIALSGWSYYFVVDKLGVPFYLYEIYFIPIIILYRNEIGSLFLRIRSKFFLVLTLITVICLAVGMIRNPDYIGEQIKTIRTLVYVIIFAYIFANINRININRVQLLCFSSTIGQFLFILLVANNNEQTALNIMALSMMIMIPILKNQFLVSIISILIGLVVAFRSSFRVSIVVVIISAIIAVIFSLLKKTRVKTVILLLCGCIFVSIVISNFDYLVELLSDAFGMNAMGLYRITYRLEALFNLDFQSSQDTVRFEFIMKMFTEYWNNLVPSGLIGKAVGTYGEYKDAPVLYFYHAYGSFISIPLIVFVFYKGVRFLISDFSRSSNLDYSVFGLMVIILLFLFFINGTFILATYEACLTGMIIGVWLKKSKYSVIY